MGILRKIDGKLSRPDFTVSCRTISKEGNIILFVVGLGWLLQFTRWFPANFLDALQRQLNVDVARMCFQHTLLFGLAHQGADIDEQSFALQFDPAILQLVEIGRLNKVESSLKQRMQTRVASGIV